MENKIKNMIEQFEKDTDSTVISVDLISSKFGPLDRQIIAVELRIEI